MIWKLNGLELIKYPHAAIVLIHVTETMHSEGSQNQSSHLPQYFFLSVFCKSTSLDFLSELISSNAQQGGFTDETVTETYMCNDFSCFP